MQFRDRLQKVNPLTALNNVKIIESYKISLAVKGLTQPHRHSGRRTVPIRSRAEVDDLTSKCLLIANISKNFILFLRGNIEKLYLCRFPLY